MNYDALCLLVESRSIILLWNGRWEKVLNNNIIFNLPLVSSLNYINEFFCVNFYKQKSLCLRLVEYNILFYLLNELYYIITICIINYFKSMTTPYHMYNEDLQIMQCNV